MTTFKLWVERRKDERAWRETVLDAMREGMTQDHAEDFAYHVEYKRSQYARKRLEERYSPPRERGEP